MSKDNCNVIVHVGNCIITAKITVKVFVDVYLCTAADLPDVQSGCPASATLFLASKELKPQTQQVTDTITQERFNHAVAKGFVKALTEDFTGCWDKLTTGGGGSWGDCGWAVFDIGSMVFGDFAIKAISDAVKSLDAAARTGIGFEDAWRGLRTAGLSDAAIEGIGAKVLKTVVDACTAKKPLRTAIAHSADPCEGMIAYGSTDLALQAYKARKAAGIGSGRNVAVAKLANGDYVVGFSKGAGYHSEDHILDQLKAKNIDPTEIEALYSERSPCDACAPKLENLLKPGTPITYSVPNGPGSSNLLYRLIQRFEGRASLRSTQHSAEQ